MTVSFNYEDNAPYSVAFVANALSYTELPATKLGIVVLWKSSFERGIYVLSRSCFASICIY